MLKILKFENIFGIKKLNNCQLLGQKNVDVIYSPNGTMKSSFSDAIRNINDGISCSDIFSSSSQPNYELNNNGVQILPASTTHKIDCVVFSGGEEFNFASSDPDLKNLVVSPSFQQLVASQRAIIDFEIANDEKIIESAFNVNSKQLKTFEKSLSVLIKKPGLVGKDLYRELLSNFAFASTPTIKGNITPLDFIESANEKVEKCCSNPEVSRNSTLYMSLINTKSALPIFNNGFSLNQLNVVVQTCHDNHYFDAGHKLYMNGTNYDENALNFLIKTETANIYKTQPIKDVFDMISSSFDANPQTRKFKNILGAHSQLAGMLGSFTNLLSGLFVTILGSSVSQLSLSQQKIVGAENAIRKLATNASINNNQIFRIWEQFKSRFSFNKFDLEIANKIDAVSGASFPYFEKVIKGTKTVISNPKDCRLSTGEIRSFYLINLIIEVELMRSKGVGFCLVLDDVAESFDYRNKYGIIEYAKEIATDKNVQIIALTHNFDFYRSLILAIGKVNLNSFFAYRSANDEVTLHSTTSENYYLELSSFNSWSKKPTLEEFFAEIPFVRNVVQLGSNSKNKYVVAMDRYLHYNPLISEQLDFTQLIPVFSYLTKSFPQALLPTSHYLKTLLDCAASLATRKNQINETDLSQKMTLGIFLRVFLERMLCKIISFNQLSIPVWSTNVKYCWTNSLFSIAKKFMDSNQISHFYEIQVISPSTIHANSFMYEPLIDVGTESLVSATLWLINVNAQWPVV